MSNKPKQGRRCRLPFEYGDRYEPLTAGRGAPPKPKVRRDTAEAAPLPPPSAKELAWRALCDEPLSGGVA